jgi:signal transduction histidine kinase
MLFCVFFSVVLYHVAVSELQTGINNQYTRWLNVYQNFGLRTPTIPTTELPTRARHILIELVYLNLLVLVITIVIANLVAKRTLRPIEDAHEQQKRFTADVSHELRTPLTALKMESEVTLFNKKASAKELRETLESNLEEVRHMETLVNNLLLLSSMEANKLRTVFTRLELKDIINDAVHAVGKLADAKKMKIKVDIESLRVRGEQTTLTQLFAILLENAVKYSPEQSEVVISMSKTRSQVTVNIEDKGKGIAADALPHIFDRFYRADSSRGRADFESSTQGFGLGLSLAKLIADLHDGEIIVSSTEGKGTIVSVILSY